MSRPGFIHDKLDIKFLILYLMARVAAPVDFTTLAELSFCDNGVTYFDFAEALSELVNTGHLTLSDDRYAITDKGRRNGSVCEDNLPFSVRQRCDRGLSRINAVLRRDAQVRTELLPRTDGSVTLRMILDDEKGNLMTLDVLTVSEEQGARLAERFRAQPEKLYLNILQVLLEEEEESNIRGGATNSTPNSNPLRHRLRRRPPSRRGRQEGSAAIER